MSKKRKATKGKKAKATKRQAKKANAPASTAKAKKSAGDANPKRVSALDAAAQVLAKASEPMGAKDLIAAMEEQGLWKSPAGKTPHATLYAAIIRDIGKKGNESRFKKVDRGHFAMAK